MKPTVAPLTLPGLDATYEEAMELAGRLLSARGRTVKEMRERLAGSGFEDHTVDLVVARLGELGLVDDVRLANDWVAERSSRKSLGPAALARELELRGVSAEVIADAVAPVADREEAKARELAAKLVARYADLNPARQAARLQGALARKGYSEEAILEAIRSVLPPEGWD
ncbi:MAG: recombination regulator RecX [Actinomycetota bacterium]|nr:recombination regulator RecX [Actinomycetota bacterium]